MRQFQNLTDDELLVIKQLATEVVNLGDRLVDMLYMLEDNKKDKLATKNINTALEDFCESLISAKDQMSDLLDV
jgi:hypothetical protein